ncbi:hypothetical protein BDV23DRAFT_178007 [Aspergillus alliaceus]|uniref:Ankyrin repeat-containing domain protein n=1 Tax=Petromyces alliaceus TaxID=209559 RepID=A0A5N7CPV3_PETAA|nr:hypothetical protein BDV23DRAFT_178007 [Aspergillus alliaceus]
MASIQWILVGTTRQHVDPWDNPKMNSDPAGRRIIHSPKSLIEQRRGGTTLQFIYLSIHDSLLPNQRLRTFTGQPRWCQPRLSTEMLLSVCDEMKLPIEKDYHVVRSYPFLPYASKYIFYHAESAQASGVFQRKCLQALLKHSKMDKILTAFYRLLTDHRCGYVPHILLLDGPIYIVRVFSSFKGHDVDTQNGVYYGNALQVAIAGGHIKMVQLLLDPRADVNTKGAKYAFPASCSVA